MNKTDFILFVFFPGYLSLSLWPLKPYEGLKIQDLRRLKDMLIVETADMLQAPLFTAEALLRAHGVIITQPKRIFFQNICILVVKYFLSSVQIGTERSFWKPGCLMLKAAASAPVSPCLPLRPAATMPGIHCRLHAPLGPHAHL